MLTEVDKIDDGSGTNDDGKMIRLRITTMQKMKLKEGKDLWGSGTRDDAKDFARTSRRQQNDEADWWSVLGKMTSRCGDQAQEAVRVCGCV